MKKIVCILGFTGSGKSGVLDQIMEFVNSHNDTKTKIGRLVYHTTRDIRSNEEDGKDYYFDEFSTPQEILDEYKDSLIEYREYFTLNDKRRVYYYTVANDIDNSSYNILVTTASPLQYEKYLEYYGKENVFGIFLEVSAKTRIKRVINNRDATDDDCYELCRRILDEVEEFNEAFDNDEILNTLYKINNDNRDIGDTTKEIIRHTLTPLLLSE